MSQNLTKKAEELEKLGNLAKAAQIYCAVAEKSKSSEEQLFYLRKAIDTAKKGENYLLVFEFLKTFAKLFENKEIQEQDFLNNGIELVQTHILPSISENEKKAEVYTLLNNFALKAQLSSAEEFLYQAGKAWRATGKELIETASPLTGRGKIERGIKAFLEAEEIFRYLQLPNEVVETLIEEAMGLFQRQEDQKAMELIQQALDVPNTNVEHTALIIGQSL
ncbi:MAG: hypothetical protein ACFFBD_04625, partial [Candidatus Hodarchaeota archaeon]